MTTAHQEPVHSAPAERLLPTARGVAPGRNRLAGKRILVVGGGQTSYPGAEENEPFGNGRAISVLCGREGASVVIADRDHDSAAQTADLVRAEGAGCDVVVGDATDEADMISFIDHTSRKLGGIDGLILAVGIERGHLFAGTAVEDWDTVFAVNVRSHFLGCKHGLPAMSDNGSIVLISSTGAFSAGIEVPAYSASKSALTGIGNHAAREGASRGIRCNLVAPGPQDTPLGRSGSRRRSSRAAIPVPIGRYGTAWDTAYAVCYLVSDESTFMTGQTMVVDGGRMLR